MHQKIRASHLQRDAYLYVRQSTMRQVHENTESGQRQYQLRERALELGWEEDRIRVVDCDQGRSGASEAGRDGFQRLVAEVGLGNAGVVMGLEVSRLARNNADWHRLLQLCAVTDTLILDQDGLYDPSSFNDRLLLGLKGTMSEAELHVLKTRMQEGLVSKARRGELRIPLPAGLVYDELDRVVLTPDRQVRDCFAKFFDSFRRLGAASAVVREFRREGLRMPRYGNTGPKSGSVVRAELSGTRALRILHNPRYAGAYAYGRHESRQGPDGGRRARARSQDEWISLIHDAHDGYIGWDEYTRNQRTLAANAQASGYPSSTTAREGPALLQGLIVCGICGRPMRVHYRAGSEQARYDYICDRAKRDMIEERVCQRVPGADVDSAVGTLLAGMVDDEAVDVAVAVHSDLQARLGEADRLRSRHVERCRYEADLARRRYLNVDPGKRYVAQILEAEWDERMRDLRKAEEELEHDRQRDRQLLDTEATAGLRGLPEDFASLWQSNRLGHRDRKRVLRLLVEDVTFVRAESVAVNIRFRGGTVHTLTLPAPRLSWQVRMTPPEVIRTIDELLDEHPECRIAPILNERGLRTGTGLEFTRARVKGIRLVHGLSSRRERLIKQGKLTARQLAGKLGVSGPKIRQCRKWGLLEAHEYKSGYFLYDDPGPDVAERVPQLRRNARIEMPHSGKEVQYDT